jgi:hypothetical protein
MTGLKSHKHFWIRRQIPLEIVRVPGASLNSVNPLTSYRFSSIQERSKYVSSLDTPLMRWFCQRIGKSTEELKQHWRSAMSSMLWPIEMEEWHHHWTVLSSSCLPKVEKSLRPAIPADATAAVHHLRFDESVRHFQYRTFVAGKRWELDDPERQNSLEPWKFYSPGFDFIITFGNLSLYPGGERSWEGDERREFACWFLPISFWVLPRRNYQPKPGVG